MAGKTEVREASELGLKPGEWPITMQIEGHQVWKGPAIFADPGGKSFIGYVYGNIGGEYRYEVLND